jgi:hypothetical protein
MYYIQRYHEKDKVNQKEANNNPTIGRFLDGDYMGSAEFDFGSVSRSWANMLENLPKIHRLDLTFKSSFVTKEVPMFVIAEESQLDSIKDELNKHLDGKRVGKLTKEYTGLWETFKHHYIEKQERTWGLVDLWLDVSPFVRTGRTDVRSAVFGLDPKLVIRVYMELLRAKLMKDKAPEVSIGDLVYVQRGTKIVEAKVTGIGEYFTYTLSYFQNRMAVSVFDVLAKKDVQDDSFVKMIRDLDTSTPTL